MNFFILQVILINSSLFFIIMYFIFINIKHNIKKELKNCFFQIKSDYFKYTTDYEPTHEFKNINLINKKTEHFLTYYYHYLFYKLYLNINNTWIFLIISILISLIFKFLLRTHYKFKYDKKSILYFSIKLIIILLSISSKYFLILYGLFYLIFLHIIIFFFICICNTAEKSLKVILDKTMYLFHDTLSDVFDYLNEFECIYKNNERY